RRKKELSDADPVPSNTTLQNTTLTEETSGSPFINDTNTSTPSSTERRNKSNVMVIKAESAPSKTILRAIWPVPDSLAGIEDGINPTHSPTGATGQNPTPSPTGIIQLSPTPSPTSPDPTPSPSTTTELVPTPSPTGDPGLQPTPSSLDNIGLNPTPSPTKIGLTPTPSPFTTIVSNGAPKSTESRSAKVTLPSVTFSTTAQNGAEKAEPLNLCLVFYCCLMVLMNV
ncbi:Hypothetical predicted protein, partial [Mytilus galloprovincialis]